MGVTLDFDFDIGYTKVPNDLIKSDLTDAEFRLLCYYASNKKGFKIYRKNTSNTLNKSERTISDLNTKLQEKGYLRIIKKRNDKGEYDSEYIITNKFLSAVDHEQKTAHGEEKKTAHDIEQNSSREENFPHNNTNTLNNTNNNNTKNNKKEIYFENLETNELFTKFLQVRKEKKKSLTETSIKMMIEKLTKYSDDVIKQALTQSITMGYQGVFPENFVKEKNNKIEKRTEKQSDFSDQVVEVDEQDINELFKKLGE